MYRYLLDTFCLDELYAIYVCFITIGRKLVVITCRVNLVVLYFKCTNHWIFVWREPPKEGVTRPNAAQPAVQSKTLLLDHQATSQGPDRSVGTGHGHSHSIAAATASTTTGNENCFAQVIKLTLAACFGFIHSIHANPPGLSGSLPDTTPISRSPVRVTISPG